MNDAHDFAVAVVADLKAENEDDPEKKQIITELIIAALVGIIEAVAAFFASGWLANHCKKSAIHNPGILYTHRLQRRLAIEFSAADKIHPGISEAYLERTYNKMLEKVKEIPDQTLMNHGVEI